MHVHQFLKETEQVYKVGIAFPAVRCVPSHERSRYLRGVRGFVYSLVSNVEIQVIHPLHHPPLSLVSDLGRLFDGDTCGADGGDELSDGARNSCRTSAWMCSFQSFAGHPGGPANPHTTDSEEYSHDGTMNCGSVFPAYPSLV